MRRLRIALALAILATLAVAATASAQLVIGLGLRTQNAQVYITNFSTVENPLSEGGRWTGGDTVGLDWSDIRVSNLGGQQVAHGTQATTNGPPYDDSVAILTGVWGPTQTVSATVYTVNQTSATFEEVELWGRSAISAHTITGYEVAFRVTHDGSQYIGVAKWLGPLGQGGCILDCAYSVVGAGNCDAGTGYTVGIHNGDTISVTFSGTSTVTITAYVNGVQQCQRTDTSAPYTTGNPGLGHWLRVNGNGSASDYGLTSFAATGAP